MTIPELRQLQASLVQFTGPTKIAQIPDDEKLIPYVLLEIAIQLASLNEQFSRIGAVLPSGKLKPTGNN